MEVKQCLIRRPSKQQRKVHFTYVFFHYVVYAVCKKEPGPTCFQISKVREDATAPLSKWKESIGTSLLQKTNIKAGLLIIMLKLFSLVLFFFFLPLKSTYFNISYSWCFPRL